MYIGPVKTGTTSVQLNILNNKQFRKTLEEDDNYQIISLGGFRKIGRLRDSCFKKQERDSNCKENIQSFSRMLDDAYDIAMSKYHNDFNQEFITLHPVETWSDVNLNDFNLQIMYDLFHKWDLHIVMFYRPYADWIASWYAQKLGTIFRYFRGYTAHKRVEPITKFLDTNKDNTLFHGTMGNYAFYEALLAKMNLPNHSSFSDYGNRIQVLNMHSLHGVEKEFINYLPHANSTKQRMKNLETRSKDVFKTQNAANNKHILGSVLMVHAWRKEMVSIGPENGGKRLEEALRHANITEDDLPQICLTGSQEELVWQRHLLNHKRFAPMFESEIDEDVLRKSFDEKKRKRCSVDGERAVQMKEVKKIFQNCVFHSQYHIKADLAETDREDLAWIKMGCNKTQHS